MFGALSGGEKPKPGRPEKIWLDCVSENLKTFQATSGSTEDYPSVFGVETALWTTAAKRWDKWCDGIVEGAERFMAEWHQPEERRRGAPAMRKRRHEAQGIGGGRGGSITTVVVLLQLKRAR